MRPPDEDLALSLLRGELEPDSEEEREAHRALARLFRNALLRSQPLSPIILLFLGDLLDPDGGGENDLKIVLRPTHRREGRPSDPTDFAIALLALEHGRGGTKFAQRTFNVTPSKVKRALKRHGKKVRALLQTRIGTTLKDVPHLLETLDRKLRE
jgi:hypothetical protein